jgi:hypothetical protein
MRRPLAAFVVGLILAAAPTFAGIADSPLPVLTPAEKTLHLYSIPGVIRAVSLGTFFSCTSTDTAPMQVGVEIFAVNGALLNDAAASSLSVGPGATVMFGTSIAPGFAISSDLGAPAISKGSARVLSTSKKLICTAFVADRFNDPPQTSFQLTIIAKLKQKAAN